jgi:hypothetical protein
MMAVGGVFLLITGMLVWRLVKRANAERAARGLGRRIDRSRV